MRRGNILLIAVTGIALASCAPSEESIATALAQTAEHDALLSLAKTATRQAQYTSTPTITLTPTLTPIPTATDTPAPTLTPTPPEGEAYVPDFIGMSFDEAKAILKDSVFNWYYVALIRTDLPEWQVFMQEPRAGSRLKLDSQKIKIVFAVHKFTPTPKPPPRQGKKSSDPCGGIDYFGICINNVIFWCEKNTLYYYQCGDCGGFCAWHDSVGFYCACP